jgi:phosphate transport system permease protein
MNVSLLILIVAALGVAGFLAGRARAMSSAGGDMRRLHSLPNYYGQSVLLYTAVPALIVTAVWLVVQPMLIERQVAGHISPSDIAENSTVGLVMGDVRRVAGGAGRACRPRHHRRGRP